MDNPRKKLNLYFEDSMFNFIHFTICTNLFKILHKVDSFLTDPALTIYWFICRSSWWWVIFVLSRLKAILSKQTQVARASRLLSVLPPVSLTLVLYGSVVLCRVWSYLIVFLFWWVNPMVLQVEYTCCNKVYLGNI